jgi:O-antigen ligase
MKKGFEINKSTEVIPVRWILGGLAAITLYFQTNLNDPFSSPKLWILLIVASWLLGYIVRFRNIISANKALKTTLYITLIFIFFALLATLLSDFKYFSLIGETQRRNGFLAYLSLSIIFIASSLVIRVFNVMRLFVMTYFIASITVVYATMQISGNDFVKWNNPYNAIIGTVGNPNFAAAIMAIMGVIVFSSVFISDTPIYLRVFGIILVLIILGLIYKSNARQGLLSYSIGVGIFLIIWLFGKNRNLGVIGAIGGVVTLIFAVLGMLQIGPLEKLLYKSSVSVRGHYWRAGIEMLKDNPFFGVGMDRYGAFFKEYRDVGYPLSYGFDITSTNAHNIFIQFFATGGIFLGASYLILNGYVLRRAIICLKNLNGNDRLRISGIFSAWVAFHSQSLVSIDNIGISIWGWVLGGSIIGLSISTSTSVSNDRKVFIGRQSDISLGRVLTSSIGAVLAIVLVTLLYRGESNTFNSRINVDLQDQSMVSAYRDLQLKVIKSPLIDPNYSLNSAISLVQAGFTDEGLEIVRKIHASDPRNLDAINGLALTLEQLDKIPDAIIYRLKLAELDPWNAVNYLELGKDYKKVGDLIKSQAMFNKVISFATGMNGGPIADLAKIELAQ